MIDVTSPSDCEPRKCAPSLCVGRTQTAARSGPGATLLCVRLRIAARSWSAVFAAALGVGGQAGCSSGSSGSTPDVDADLSDARSNVDGGLDAPPSSSIFACENGVPWSIDGGPSGGLERCESGMLHRPAAGSCGTGPPWPTGGVPDPLPKGAGAVLLGDGCRKDSECTAMAHGYCAVILRSGPEPSESNCTYACSSDADCAAGYLCACGETVSTCVPADCATDADCGGMPCILLPSVVTCGQPAQPKFSCGTDGQECAADSQCPEFQACIAGNCESLMNICGRPFLVGGIQRQATAVRRNDWAQAISVSLDGLDSGARNTLAEHYTNAGLMEHASIAAFARFVMDLLALGAPPHLLEAACGAVDDERVHAQICFGLASEYAGVRRGPGRINVEGALQSGGSGEVLETTFREMCIGETCAAMEVAESALRASEPTVRTALERIAADETRHATLGWKFVKWLLDGQSAADRKRSLKRLRSLVAAEGRRRATAARTRPAPEMDDLVAHGYLSDAVRSAVHTSAINDVVAPCVETLARPPGPPEDRLLF